MNLIHLSEFQWQLSLVVTSLVGPFSIADIPSSYSTRPPGPTQPGHPSMVKQNEYWW